jgi:bifunctional DNA-binding transcriptional regulator/antitoxin component of YhaV-PrlF toxin-antitoxin module
MTSWTITPEEDPETGDLIITFPPEALAEVGWKEGDVLTWTMKTNGSIILSKKDEDEKCLL